MFVKVSICVKVAYPIILLAELLLIKKNNVTGNNFFNYKWIGIYLFKNYKYNSCSLIILFLA